MLSMLGVARGVATSHASVQPIYPPTPQPCPSLSLSSPLSFFLLGKASPHPTLDETVPINSMGFEALVALVNNKTW